MSRELISLFRRLALKVGYALPDSDEALVDDIYHRGRVSRMSLDYIDKLDESLEVERAAFDELSRNPVSPWISVDDPPKESGDYLTFHSSGRVNQNWWNIAPNFSIKTWWSNNDFNVTHWMPIPNIHEVKS